MNLLKIYKIKYKRGIKIMNNEIKNFSNMEDKKSLKNMKKITGKVSDARPNFYNIFIIMIILSWQLIAIDCCRSTKA